MLRIPALFFVAGATAMATVPIPKTLVVDDRSCPKLLFDGHVRLAPLPIPLGDLPPGFLERFDEQMGREHRSQLNAVVYFARDFLRNGRIVEVVDLRLGPDVLATAECDVVGNTMRFDIVVVPQFRRTGLYDHLLRRALERHPNVQAIPADMRYDRSENVRLFVEKAFSSPLAFAEFEPFPLDRTALAAIRRRWLEAFYAMPAMRVRTRRGFGRVTSLLVDPARQSVTFQCLRGAPLRPAEVLVAVRAQSEIHLVTPEGSLVPDSEERFALRDYFADEP